jgi:hypothetical protein
MFDCLGPIAADLLDLLTSVALTGTYCLCLRRDPGPSRASHFAVPIILALAGPCATVAERPRILLLRYHADHVPTPGGWQLNPLGINLHQPARIRLVKRQDR